MKFVQRSDGHALQGRQNLKAALKTADGFRHRLLLAQT
jgi:hypothetical protein